MAKSKIKSTNPKIILSSIVSPFLVYVIPTKKVSIFLKFCIGLNGGNRRAGGPAASLDAETVRHLYPPGARGLSGGELCE